LIVGRLLEYGIILTFRYKNKGGDVMKQEIFSIEWEDRFHIFLLDENNKILDGATIEKHMEDGC